MLSFISLLVHGLLIRIEEIIFSSSLEHQQYQEFKKYPPITYYWTVPLMLDHSKSCWEISKFENC
jgi:hypothetical protein